MKYALSILLLMSLGSCHNEGTNSLQRAIPVDMQPDWTGIEIDSLPIKFGQLLSLNTGTINLQGIVLDFDQDNDGLWVGICLVKDSQLFGRQIPNGLVAPTCLDLLDLVYLRPESLDDYMILDSLQINKSKVGIGSITPILDYDELQTVYDHAILQRKKEQTPCDKGMGDLAAVRECYFALDMIQLDDSPKE